MLNNVLITAIISNVYIFFIEVPGRNDIINLPQATENQYIDIYDPACYLVSNSLNTMNAGAHAPKILYCPTIHSWVVDRRTTKSTEISKVGDFIYMEVNLCERVTLDSTKLSYTDVL